MQYAWKLAVVALIALAFTALPGGGVTLNVLLTALSITFFTLIALLGARLYRQFSFELDSLTERQRLVLYSSIALAFLTFCATRRLFDTGGVGAIAWFSLLGLCSFGLYWCWVQYRTYG